MSIAGKKILIIEDDEHIARVYSIKLGKEGVTLFNAHDGEDGLRKIQSEMPDIVLLPVALEKGHVRGVQVRARFLPFQMGLSGCCARQTRLMVDHIPAMDRHSSQAQHYQQKEGCRKEAALEHLLPAPEDSLFVCVYQEGPLP